MLVYEASRVMVVLGAFKSERTLRTVNLPILVEITIISTCSAIDQKIYNEPL